MTNDASQLVAQGDQGTSKCVLTYHDDGSITDHTGTHLYKGHYPYPNYRPGQVA